MGKKRVYELAKELGISSKSFIERAQALGYSWIQSHANTLEGSEAKELAQKLSAGGGESKPKRKSTVLRRRAVRVDKADNGTDSGYEVVTTRISDSGAEVIERKQIEMSVPPSFLPAKEAPISESLEVAEVVSVEASGPETSSPVVETTPEATPVAEVVSEASPSVTEEPVVEAASPEPVKEAVAEPTPVEETTTAEPVEIEKVETEKVETKKVEPVAEPVVAEAEVHSAPIPAVPPRSAKPRAASSAKASGDSVQNQRVTSRKTPVPTRESAKASSIMRIESDSKWGDEGMRPKAQPSPGSGPGQRRSGPDRRDGRQQTDGRGGDNRGKGGRGGRGGERQKRGGRYNAGGRDSFGRGRRGQEAPRSSRRRKKGKKGEPSQPTTVPMRAEKRVVKVDGAISVAELAKRMGVKAAELIGDLLRQGVMATINDVISVEQAEGLAKSKGYEVKDTSVAVDDILQREDSVEAPESLVPRPPVVTVMGHVDHGKTSLLDAIRETRVADGEAGGITQHIGASVVTLPGGRDIVFLDTPGHEAFTAMRSRGAQSTDIVILVVAADDSVMPQTIEAISHSQAAGVPIVVAVNKIDKAGADSTRVRTDLMQYNLIPEEYGGDTQIVDVSAHTKQGLPELLEGVLLQAEIMELTANPNRKAQGIVIESRFEKGRGAVSTVLIQAGTIRSGDAIVAGMEYGRVRAMFDHTNKPIKEAGPSTPVKILGLSGTPSPGDTFDCVEDERAARQVADLRRDEKKNESATPTRSSLQDLWGAAQKKELHIILKTDVEGTLEALKQSLLKMQNDEIELSITHAAVGGITENDINLASTTGSVVFGFSVRADNKAQKLAESEGIEIRTYRVIYELIDDVKAAMERQLAPTLQEKPIGQAQIRKLFNIPKAGKVAGCYVTEGKITRGSLIRLYRENKQIYEGKVQTLRRFKNDVKEVATGYECGIQIEGYQDIRESDMIEAYEIEEIATKLKLES